jgi:hypothetical protein
LSDNENQDEPPQTDYEGGIPILHPKISEIERQRTEYERQDAEYKSRQIALNEKLANATVWLVVATVGLVISTLCLGGFQIWYMHRQWKLTSASLSKMGDEIWAAKNAAYASKAASDTAGQALKDSESSFGQTLSQMQRQTRAQEESNRITRDSLVSVQRAFVSFAQNLQANAVIDSSGSKINSWEFRPVMVNNGTTTARHARQHASFLWIPAPLPNDFRFPDLGDMTIAPVAIGPKAVYTGALMTIPVSVLSLVKEHAAYLYFWGWVSYKDIFQDTPTHITMFCLQMTDVRGDPTNRAGQTQFLWRMCSKHNCVDDDCKGEPGYPGS